MDKQKSLTEKAAYSSQFRGTARWIGGQRHTAGLINQAANDIANYVYANCLKFGGNATALELNAIDAPATYLTHKVTIGGRIGTTDASEGDIIFFDGTTWVVVDNVENISLATVAEVNAI